MGCAETELGRLDYLVICRSWATFGMEWWSGVGVGALDMLPSLAQFRLTCMSLAVKVGPIVDMTQLTTSGTEAHISSARGVQMGRGVKLTKMPPKTNGSLCLFDLNCRSYLHGVV